MMRLHRSGPSRHLAGCGDPALTLSPRIPDKKWYWWCSFNLKESNKPHIMLERGDESQHVENSVSGVVKC